MGSVLTVRVLGRHRPPVRWRGMVAAAAVIVATLGAVVALGMLLTTTVVDGARRGRRRPSGPLLLVGDARRRHRAGERVEPTADLVERTRGGPGVGRDAATCAPTSSPRGCCPPFAVVGVGILLGMNALLDAARLTGQRPCQSGFAANVSR